VGRVAFEEIILQLITRKCLPILLYCLEVSPLTRNDLNSVDFVTVSSIFNVYVTLSFRCAELVGILHVVLFDTLCVSFSFVFLFLVLEAAIYDLCE